MSEEYNQFRNLMSSGKYQEAAQFAERENLRQSTQNVFWLTQQANALNRAGDHREAYDVAEEALQIERANAYAVMAAADALLGMGKAEQARQYYAEGVSQPRLCDRARRGGLQCLAYLQQWQAVLAACDQGEAPPEERMSWRVKALAGLQRSDEAIEVCHQWLKAKPHCAQALWELTELEICRDGMEAVLERLEKLIRIKSLPAVYREIYASVCRRAGKPELALKEYQNMGAAGGLRARRKQAFLLAQTGQESAALPMLEELLRADPQDRYVHSSYQAACKRAGEAQRGIDFYNELLTIFPDEKRIYGRIQALRSSIEAS